MKLTTIEEAREQVKKDLGKFWEDFDIDEILETSYEFYNGEFMLKGPMWEYFDNIKLSAAAQPQITKPYDYRKAVRQDIRKSIYYDTMKGIYQLEDFKTREEAFSGILSYLQKDDSILTGSYSASDEAENYLAHNWGLLQEVLKRTSCTATKALKKGAEWCDCLIRNCLLEQCLSDVLDEIEAKESVGWK